MIQLESVLVWVKGATGLRVRRDEDSWGRDTACWGWRWLRKIGLTGHELGFQRLCEHLQM